MQFVPWKSSLFGGQAAAKLSARVLTSWRAMPAFVRPHACPRFTRPCTFLGWLAPLYSQLASACVHRLMYLRRVMSWFQICPMTAGRHLSTWISTETKRRFASAAARQSLSESALLKRLVEQMLATVPSDHLAEPVAASDPRDARLTVRLVPEDRALLRERAAARTMHAATYVSVLVRSHLRRVAPLPDRELSSLQASVRELTAIGRNLNTMTHLLRQDARQGVPGRQEVQAMLQVCEALRDHFRALIKANLISWDVGHAEQNY